jgi:exonuclease III
MRFCTWYVRSLYRTLSLTTAASELARYKLDIVGVQEVRWDKERTVRAGGFYIFLWKRKQKSSVENMSFCTPLNSISSSLYIVLRGRWRNTSVSNVHAPSEEKSDYSKDSFCEELEQVFHHFRTYQLKILLGDFNAKVGREDIFRPTIGNENLHQDSNDKISGIINFAT